VDIGLIKNPQRSILLPSRDLLWLLGRSTTRGARCECPSLVALAVEAPNASLATKSSATDCYN
jgi:hypothetical protein